MTSFWRTWLTLWCWGVGLFGLVLVGAGFAATDGPTRALTNILHPSGPLTFDAPLRFGLGLQGALSLAIAMLTYAAIGAAEALGDRGWPVWRQVAAALGLWYFVDSAISCANGFALNAVSNTLLLAGLLIPMLATGVLKAR